MMSNARGGAIQAMTLVVGLGLAGCASGGGSSGSMMVVTPTPTPTSSSPTTFNFATPLNTYLWATPGVVTASQGNAMGPVATVTITDNDGAAGFDTVKFAGKQTVRVQIPSLSIDQTFAASTAVSVPSRDPRSGLSSAAGTVNLTSWESRNGVNDPIGFYIYSLQKGAPGTPLAATSYVSLGEWTSAVLVNSGHFPSQTGAFVLLGTATPIMPVNGGATFSGQAFGRYVTSGGSPNSSAPFLGAASLTVDFARSTQAITGSIDNAAYSNASDPLRLTLLFTADLTGANFSGAATASNAHGGTALPAAGMSGPIQGSFFGPAANEAGATFALTGGGAALNGGFVASR